MKYLNAEMVSMIAALLNRRYATPDDAVRNAIEIVVESQKQCDAINKLTGQSQ